MAVKPRGKRTPPAPKIAPAEFWMVHILPGTIVCYGRKRYKHVLGTPLKAVETTDEVEFKILTAPGKGMRKATAREIEEVKDG